VTYATAV